MSTPDPILTYIAALDSPDLAPETRLLLDLARQAQLTGKMPDLPAEIAWDGLWDLSAEAELQSLAAGWLSLGHKICVVRIQDAWQVGWRHAAGKVTDMWGLPAADPIAALRDAASRFFRANQARVSGASNFASAPPPRSQVLQWHRHPSILGLQS